MAQLGRNQQLVVAGAAAAFVAYLLGVVLDQWEITLAAATVLIASAIALALTFMAAAPSIAGVPAASVVRIAAAFTGAFALIHFGDLISDFSQESLLSNFLTVIHVVGAAVLAYGAWAASGGSIVADTRGVLGVARLDMADRFVYLGALGAIVGWFLLMWIADVFEFHTLAQIVVLVATLTLVVRWLDRNPTAGRSPLPGPWATVGLAAIAVVAGLWWLVRVLGETIELGDVLVYLTLLIFVLALAALGLGAFLSIGGTRSNPTQPAA